MAGSRTSASESARDAVMSRIRAALGDGPPTVEIPRDYERALPSGGDILELFVLRVSDYRATVSEFERRRYLRAL